MARPLLIFPVLVVASLTSGCGGESPRLDQEDGGRDGGAPEAAVACAPERTMKVIASDVGATAGFQADATSIYFFTWWPDPSETLRPYLFRVPREGGTAEIVLERLVKDLRLTGRQLTYYDYDSFRLWDTILRSELAAFPSEDPPSTWTADADGVYWLTTRLENGTPKNVLEHRLWKDAQTEVLAGDLPGDEASGLTLNGGQLFWITRTLSRTAFGPDSYQIRSWRPGAAAPSVLISSNDFLGGAQVAVDDRFAYFADLQGTSVARVARDGGPTETIATVVDGARVGAIVVDERFVYWHAQGWHAMAKAGGAPFTIADETACGTPLLVAGAFLCGPYASLQVLPNIPITDADRLWEVPTWWRDCAATSSLD